MGSHICRDCGAQVVAAPGITHDCPVRERRRREAAMALAMAARVAEEVIREGDRAAALHGEPADRTGRDWLAILAEEFGEAAAEVTRGEVPPVVADPAVYRANLRAELVQVASVSSRWVLAIDRGEGTR